jgi:hypothetical protein
MSPTKPGSPRLLGAFAQASVANSPEDWLSTSLRNRLMEFSSPAEDPAKSVDTRDLTNAAFLNLLTGGDVSRSESWIERAYTTQDMDPASKTFGELKWKTGDAAITDLNAVEFATQAIGPLYLTYGDRLSPAFTSRMAPHLNAALAGLHGHRVLVTYTNIYLMNLVNRMLIGQALGNATAVNEAEQRLDTWLDYTRRNGVHEFDSPTYYFVDVANLVAGFRYAADPGDRRKFERILDYFWTDIAANFLPSAHRIVGAYSRDYDFLSARGTLETWLMDAGWTPPPPKVLNFEAVYVLDNRRAGGYRPKSQAAALSSQLPREVVSTWDDNPSHARYVWMDRAVALGCTSGDYSPHDKLFNATFAGSPDLPQITLEPDVFDAPYGLVMNPDRSGHMKPTHLPLHVACVEHAGVALITLDLDPSAVTAKAHGFATNLVLPSDADIAVNGQPQAIATPGAVPLVPNSVVSATVGGATVGIRLLHVDDLPEQRPEFTLAADANGLAHHAVRLKLAHLLPGQQTKSQHLRVAFLLMARQDVSPHEVVRAMQGAQITSEAKDATWSVKVVGAGFSCEVARSVEDRTVIIRQWVNGESIPPSLLSVNGKDVGSNLLP